MALIHKVGQIRYDNSTWNARAASIFDPTLLKREPGSKWNTTKPFEEGLRPPQGTHLAFCEVSKISGRISGFLC